MTDNFVTKRPTDRFLSTLVDYYFFIDVPVSALCLDEEYVVPFPRVTFGYFFNHPFLVTNHDLEQSTTAEMIVSRITTHKISVCPQGRESKFSGHTSGLLR